MTVMAEAENAELTGRALRDAFAQFPSGVVAVAADVDGVATGMAVSTFAAVSLDPPLGGIFVANTSSTWRQLRRARTLGISVLSSDHSQLARTLAGPADRRFDGVAITRGEFDALFIDETPLVLEVDIENEYPAGDHTLVLLRVRSARVRPEHSALLFHRSALRGFTHSVAAP
jgi:flavin reductase (DIM6/NTAB) family NADH-FMN oxidoreductase RutF